MGELTPDQQRLADGIAEALGELDAAQMKLRHAVKTAQSAGVSWAEVGMILGVTRQAAWDRFGKD